MMKIRPEIRQVINWIATMFILAFSIVFAWWFDGEP